MPERTKETRVSRPGWRGSMAIWLARGDRNGFADDCMTLSSKKPHKMGMGRGSGYKWFGPPGSQIRVDQAEELGIRLEPGECIRVRLVRIARTR